MLKKLVLAAALVAPLAFAQQNVDISGADYASGKGDARLAALGRQAAASGKRLVVTAPPEWHAKIAAKIRAGGATDVVLRDGFYESVLVRVEDASAGRSAAAEPERAARADVERSRAEAERARAEAERSRAEAEQAKAEAVRARAEAERVRAEAQAELAKVRAQRAAVAAPAKPAPAPPPAAAAAPAPAPAVPDVAAIRSRLQQSLSNGREAEGTLAVTALQSGDVIYVDGPVRGVVRREALKAVLYWLDGDLDLRRSELKPLAVNRYQVMSAIRGQGTLRREFDTSKAEFAARVPAEGSPVRDALERKFNDGRRIVDRLDAAQLREGDIVYGGSDGAAVVVRREGKDLRRYWLDGSFDTRQSSVQSDGSGKYRIRGSLAR